MITRLTATRYRCFERLGVDVGDFRIADNDWWPLDAAKPPRPKEAAEWVLKQTRQPRSSAIYQALAEHTSIKGCTDAALADMHAAFLACFPVEVYA